MARYVAFLRGVSPQNAKMLELKRCFEAAGFGNVKTVLSSGNVVFDSSARSLPSIERMVETTMEKQLGRTFFPIVRSTATLEALLASDPYAGFSVPAEAKRVVSFVRRPVVPKVALPISQDGASILCVSGTEIFSAYVRHPKGPVFMILIQKAFGDAVTTRTWATIRKCAAS